MLGGALTAQAALIPLLTGFFSKNPTTRREALDRAVEAARARRKPLLALVVPKEDDQKYQRGTMLGAWLEHSEPATMIDLALCELVCAEADELRSRLPIEIEGEPVFVLVDFTGREPLVVLAPPHEGLLAEAVTYDVEERLDFREHAGRQDALTRKQMQRLSTLLHGGLFDELGLPHLAAEVEKSLSREELQAVVDALDAPPAEPPAEPSAVFDRAAALLLLEAEAREPAVRERIRASIAAAAVARWRERPPTGTYWANQNGCGTDIEGVEEQSLIACGMGYTPELSRRFLYFFPVEGEGG